MTNRPPPKLLEELGLVAVRWAGLESMIEITCAYLFKWNFGQTKDGTPPRPFGTRIKFIRRAIRHPAFTHVRLEMDAALCTTEGLSTARNEIMHGAFTSWGVSGSHMQAIVTSNREGYLAVMGKAVSEADLSDLSQRMAQAFAKHFNLLDRVKAIIRAFDGDLEMGRRALFHE